MPEVVLVAGRGPMAARVIRTCQSAGSKAVAVYSEADADAVHVRLADEAVLIGAPPPESSYLDAQAIVEAARVSGAEAVLPVHAILAGSLALARATEEVGLLWIGADQDALAAAATAGPPVAADRDPAGWLIGVADGFRVDGLVVGRTDVPGAHLCWTSAQDVPGIGNEGRPSAAELLARLSERVVELGWRGLVTVPFDPDGVALAIRGGVPAELGLVEIRAGRDLVMAAIALADDVAPPRDRAGTPGVPAAVGGSIRATAVPDQGRQGQVTEFTAPTGQDVRWEPGYAAGDAFWPWYDPLLAVIAVPGADLAGALRAFLLATSSLRIGGLPSDLGQLRDRAEEVAARLPGKSR